MTFEDTYKARKSHLYSSVNRGVESPTYEGGSKSGYSPPSVGRYSPPVKSSTMATPAKTAGASSSPVEVKSPSKGTPSSFLSSIAGSAGATSSSSGVRSSGGFYNFSGSTNGVRSNIESRLKWMETAFKTDQTKGGESFNAKATVGSARRRVMVLFREQMTPQMRGELQKLDKELAELSDHV